MEREDGEVRGISLFRMSSSGKKGERVRVRVRDRLFLVVDLFFFFWKRRRRLLFRVEKLSSKYIASSHSFQLPGSLVMLLLFFIPSQCVFLLCCNMQKKKQQLCCMISWMIP
jgi:hypothetical protein